MLNQLKPIPNHSSHQQNEVPVVQHRNVFPLPPFLPIFFFLSISIYSNRPIKMAKLGSRFNDSGILKMEKVYSLIFFFELYVTTILRNFQASKLKSCDFFSHLSKKGKFEKIFLHLLTGQRSVTLV